LLIDPRNTKSAFALAQLHIQTGNPLKATELYRTVLRTSTNEDEVAHAGRDAIDLEEMTDSLGELEKVLSPLSFMMAHKPVFRRVLVDLYLRYVPRLVERERHGNEEIKKAARAELARIGGHGLQPLLEALRDENGRAPAARCRGRARAPRQQGRGGAARPHGAPGAAEGFAPHRHARRVDRPRGFASRRWLPPVASAIRRC